MGLLDRIKKKNKAGISIKKSDTLKEDRESVSTNITTPSKKPTTSNKVVSNNLNLSNVLDTYTVQVEEVDFDIVIGKKEGRTLYIVPEVDVIMSILSKLPKDTVQEIKSILSEEGFEKVGEIYRFLQDYVEKNNLNLKKPEIQSLAKYFYLILGRLGFLEIPLKDDRLEEVMVNGEYRPTYVFHRKYQMCRSNIVFDEEELTRIIESIALLAGRTIDARTPMLDAFLPDGSRVNATLKEVTPDGNTLTIRKFSKDPLTVIDLIRFGTFSFEFAAFLWQAVEGYFGSKPANTLIVGGTGSGKTTTLNVISMFSMYTDRIVTIEDTPELQIPHDHVIRMVTRPPRPGVPDYEITMDDLIKNALRMRPDRIFVGEVRGEEARSLLVAMNTGHDGALVNDEPIYLSRGRVVNIGNFVDKFFQRGYRTVKEDNGFEWIDISEEGIYINSFNKKSLKIEDKLISHVWRKRYTGKLLKLKTATGREITLTYDHPLYVLRGIIFEINPYSLKVGDYIAIPGNYRKLITTSTTDGEVVVESVYPSLDISWDVVVSIEEVTYNGYIYDLTVVDNHTYIGGSNGGIVVSNCSGTLHANSASEAITRLINPPMNVPKIMLSSLDFIINQQRIKRNRKTIRRILEVIEIIGSAGEISKTTLFKYDGTEDALKKVGICMWEEEVCNIAGITREELLEDRKNRIEVLKYAYKNNIRDIKRVGELIMRYQENPEGLLMSIRG
ncbi:MAG TPA: CpaF family protein [Methanothermococcus okinawensis]|uniref:CpaF family protein n=1 Tax=Methanothermococcus okinawensis TaxID=155863 RepID=A0A832ZBU8_9EURY|nr:CpaF family protein [Methanococcaceae archaeon]HIP84895.1 CpaF family protein [Methanothermococcus okinawensis]HIP91142.1 CpaF family protein [Methanothermococcus okinawensis]